MTVRRRVRVMSDRKMVTLLGASGSTCVRIAEELLRSADSSSHAGERP